MKVKSELKCTGLTGKIVDVIFVSKYMIKKYGFDIAVLKILSRKSKCGN